jgi:hypothetical protein
MPHFIPLSISCSDNPNSTFEIEAVVDEKMTCAETCVYLRVNDFWVVIEVRIIIINHVSFSEM